MRVAWVMKLKPGNEAIYKQKHDEIWPEMLELMKQRRHAQLLDLPLRLLLFAYQERDTPPVAGRTDRSDRLEAGGR